MTIKDFEICTGSENLKIGTHDATSSPCDLLQGLVAGTSRIVCADLNS